MSDVRDAANRAAMLLLAGRGDQVLVSAADLLALTQHALNQADRRAGTAIVFTLLEDPNPNQVAATVIVIREAWQEGGCPEAEITVETR